MSSRMVRRRPSLWLSGPGARQYRTKFARWSCSLKTMSDRPDAVFNVLTKIPGVVGVPGAARPAGRRRRGGGAARRTGARRRPARRVDDMGGPEVLTAEEMLRDYMNARDLRRPVRIPLPLPGRGARIQGRPPPHPGPRRRQADLAAVPGRDPRAVLRTASLPYRPHPAAPCPIIERWSRPPEFLFSAWIRRGEFSSSTATPPPFSPVMRTTCWAPTWTRCSPARGSRCWRR